MMGTELIRVRVKEENDDIPSVPPGFESFAAFNFNRVQDGEKQESNVISCSATASASESLPVKMETGFEDEAKVTRSLRRRPWIKYGHLDGFSEDESDSAKLNQNLSSRSQLPKGVIRGCPQCSNCQKVSARWRPEYARKPDIEDAPVFYPTEEEFEDTLKYIASIRPKAEQYGICRIVPPPSWKPPCPLKEETVWKGSTFATRVQRVDKLQNRDSMRKMSTMSNHTRKKRRRCMRMAIDCGADIGSISRSNDTGVCEAESFGFEPGPLFTLDKFQKYADDFMAQYFRKDENTINKGGSMTMLQENREPTLDSIEGEYWRIVEKATEEIEVLYGADLETGVFGSGFPKTSSEVGSATNDRYTKSGWNLNNFPRLPGSVLSFESGDISGVLVPWLYIGMCFSSFCWHVEDHHLYSLNYMHWGAQKIWYGVPGKDAVKLEEAMRMYLPDLFEEQPDLLHKLVTQLSPNILKSIGVPVYRCVQNSGEFVLTFPRAYHSGFNCGFNCAEAVNVAPVDWLPHGQTAIELYREQGRRTSISHDKLLLGAAREAVRAHWELNLLKRNKLNNLRWKDMCGKDGILAKAFKERVETEHVRRQFLCNSSPALKMESDFDATSERECSVCLFDLHLSAVGCHCSPDKYTCLNHAKQLCSCVSGARFFLFRYDISELNILVEALEGKLSAVYRWARLDLGLALTSFVSKDNAEEGKLSCSPKRTATEQVRSHASVDLHKVSPGRIISGDFRLNSAGICWQIATEEEKKPPEDIPSKDARASAVSHSSFQVIEKENDNFKLNQKGSSLLSTNLRTLACQLSQEDPSYTAGLASEKCERKKPSTLCNDNIILLSDDEGDELKPISERAKENVSVNHSSLSEKLSISHDRSCNDNKDSILTFAVINGAVKSEKNVSLFLFPDENNSPSGPLQVKDGYNQDGGKVLGFNQSNGFCHAGPSTAGFGRNIQNFSSNRDAGKDNRMANAGSQQPQPCGSGKPNIEDEMGANATSTSVDNSRIMAGSPSSSQNNLDRYYRQKGPRIAKVVRRINCNVEPLEFGVVLSGKSWCNNQAIFPKGFRSRVRYLSVLDPTSMCYYVSEILDAGRNSPLFMVSLEHYPNEVFIHVSAARCWEMVRERVNQEITKQHKTGRTNLPPLQPPGSLDGFEMFGFSSPAIVQAVEALDRNRVCTDYWDSRPYSRPQGQIPQHSQSKANARHSQGTSEDQNNRKVPGSQFLPAEVDTTLGGLFKKASPEELILLSRVLSDNKPTANPGLITQLLNEEIHNRPR
ncbi:lysine-specific demethylase JMJ16 [Populus alba x Populus x berolinensis]|uniref:Lysine-specific demethylase JMJ16 n=4 Tax=Populus TaxID=3689 RepID=A0A4U5QLA5_POPAL|nr:putative lysine-specific demethylase JMJ16 [Populus alba]XP_034916935.1 putative lysine-specific demethylase JMJ16 [Populus alba]XP_034916936.1 putative lysine-specific demethylase JMJ16 [Populus alba]XP_034916937.1 putative lysine-specific demethylase JMJ16 [Populus alba]XP_034916938.1 putative lysine-specific demethylase JMJ16 [Populus alba]KAJ6858236.1 lysine-specific demethylase JMJ16 [Populus alba x Populus x berolinensis]KAJ6951592.1 lysine-specific demethylase JMJ16 [Populus alba x 